MSSGPCDGPWNMPPDRGGMPMVFELADMQFSPTAWLFEGAKRGGAGVSMFIVRTPPGVGVDLHVHPYHETFLMLEGLGRWTAGEEVVELRPDQMLVVP